MSRIYSFLESQVNALLKMVLINSNGEFDAGVASAWLQPGNVQLLITFVTGIAYLVVLSVVGVYLWNNGLHVMAPVVIKPFGSGVYTQNPNRFAQLFVTLLALSVFF
jgi:hypothetical protein